MKTREEEIKQAATKIAKEWYCGPEDEFHYEVEKLEEMGQWADEHPKNPWRDAKKELPKEEGWVYVNGERLSIYYYKNNKWYDERENITFSPDYWMPIPELPKGE